MHSNLFVRSDLFWSRQQLLKVWTIPDRIPDWIDLQARYRSYLARWDGEQMSKSLKRPASPQFITRCAMLMPAPAILACSFRSGDFIHRPTVNSHAHAKLGIFFKLFTDLGCAQNRCFGTRTENQRGAVVVGKRSSLPSDSVFLNCSVPRTIAFRVSTCPLC